MAPRSGKAATRRTPRSTALVPPAAEALPGALRTFAGKPGAASPPAEELANLQRLHEVWLRLRGAWSWLAVIPAEPGFSSAALAHALSQVGAHLSGRPIDFIDASPLDLDSSSSLLCHLGSQVGVGSVWVQSGPRPGQQGWTRRANRTLVSMENPIENPLALPVALAADGLVLCVRRGRTRAASIRRSIDALGPERILCWVLLD